MCVCAGVIVALKYTNVLGIESEETVLINCLTLVEINGMLERDANFMLGFVSGEQISLSLTDRLCVYIV